MILFKIVERKLLIMLNGPKKMFKLRNLNFRPSKAKLKARKRLNLQTDRNDYILFNTIQLRYDTAKWS